MRAVICKEEDALSLILGLEVKQHELMARFRQQTEQQAYVCDEVMRGVRYVVVGWLTEHGFKVTR